MQRHSWWWGSLVTQDIFKSHSVIYTSYSSLVSVSINFSTLFFTIWSLSSEIEMTLLSLFSIFHRAFHWLEPFVKKAWYKGNILVEDFHFRNLMIRSNVSYKYISLQNILNRDNLIITDISFTFSFIISIITAKKWTVQIVKIFNFTLLQRAALMKRDSTSDVFPKF